MSDLPVDPERLRQQFPELTDADIEAYVNVTRRILEKNGTAERGKLTRDIMETARAARAKSSAGAELTERERQALRYLAAVGNLPGPPAMGVGGRVHRPQTTD
jgi:hypothetical protein